jgi:hypothetical protein
MFNFETLESLNLASNWFGQEGLIRFKDQFHKFQNLKSLNMSNNKLAVGEYILDVRDCFAACGEKLEELIIMENSWKDDIMEEYLAPVIGSQMPNLRVLNLARNPLSVVGIDALL